MEEKLEFYYTLGNALYKLYDGQTLTHDELTLIASSSSDEKIMALEFNASKRLGMRTDRSFDNFYNNNNSLKLINFTNKKR